MAQKSRNKKKKSRGGSARIVSDASTSADLDAFARGLADGLARGFADGLSLDPEPEVVEVLYTEHPLKRVETVPFGTPFSGDWLHGCVQQSCSEWREFLPSVEPVHLMGRWIPESAQSVSEISVGRGAVLVELKEANVNEGLVGQVAMAHANSLSSTEEMAQMVLLFETKLAKERETTKAAIQSVREEIGGLRDRVQILEEEKLQAKESLKDTEQEVKCLKKDLHDLQTSMKIGLRLANKVKQRVALSLARTEVEVVAGKTKPDSESWAAFMGGFSPTDWQAVGVSKKLVKELLADGAYEFNDSIHNIPAEQVVGSIACMRQGSLRNAWEEIFFLAFKKRVSDELFVEEIDLMTQQQLLLGGGL